MKKALKILFLCLLSVNLSYASIFVPPTSSTGDVIGPASSTDNALVRFDLTTGKLLKNSTVILSNSGDFTGLDSLNIATTETTGFGIDLSSTTTTTGALLRGVLNSADSSLRNGFFFRNQHTSATGTTVAQFQQDAANTNVTMTQNANGVNLLLQSNATTNASLRAFPTLQTSASIISVPTADSLTSGSILNAVSASNSNTARNILYGEQGSATATSAVVARFVQAGPAGAFVVDRTNTNSTTAAWTINDSNASTGGSIQINKTGAGFGSNVGLINIARTGNITGIDTEAMVDFSISPVFTFTESASGSNLYAGASINMANVGVTPTGTTSTMTTALLLVGGGDGDANNYALISNGAALFQTTLQIGNSGNTISGHYSGTATNLTTASIAAGTCGNLGTITVTGAAVGDTVYATPDPSSSASGVEDLNLSWMTTVTASNTVTIRACNNQTVGAIDPGDDQEWRADVWHH